MTALKAGDVVYRVVEVDPEEGPQTWVAVAVVVERASDRQVRLAEPLPGVGGKLFKPTALGRYYFPTPLEAVRYFAAGKRLEIESLERRRAAAERAVAWAESQEVTEPGD